VVIPFNKYRPQTVLQAIYSVTNQTYGGPIEVIAVDSNPDGDDRASLNLRKRFPDLTTTAGHSIAPTITVNPGRAT